MLVPEVLHTVAPKFPCHWQTGPKDPVRADPEINVKGALKFPDAAAPELAVVREAP